MKVLLANLRYFVMGGPGRYMFTVKDALERRGHEAIPFSIRYSRNEPTPYEKYFVSPLAGADAVTFAEHRWTPRSALKTLGRAFYSPEVRRAVERLAADTRPDVAYVLLYLKKLSPSLLAGLHKQGVPIVVRISDYLMLCPQALFLRDGQTCTLCAHGALWPSIRYRCVKGSFAASVVHALSTLYHRARGYFDLVDRWVIPSRFTMEKMIEAGWPSERLVHIPTFTSDDFFAESPPRGADHILFVGHFEPHKGPDVLIRAYAELARRDGVPDLVMAGDLAEASAGSCRQLAQSLGVAEKVRFVGYASGPDLVSLYRRAVFTVVPSICYENMPNVILESFACAAPVIGSDLGSIRELVRNGENGFLFEVGQAPALARAMEKALAPGWAERAGQAARQFVRENMGQDLHMERLLALFESLRR